MARPRGFDEDTVLDQAFEQFRRTGFHGTSVDDLSRATGLSKGSLYGAFGDKRALHQRVLDDYCGRIVDATREQLDGPVGPVLRRLRDWLTPAVGPDPVGCLLAKATSELANEDPDVAARSRAAHGALLAAVADAVRAARESGEVRADVDPDAAAAMLLAVQRGLEALGRGGVDARTLALAADAAIDAVAVPRG